MTLLVSTKVSSETLTDNETAADDSTSCVAHVRRGVLIVWAEGLLKDEVELLITAAPLCCLVRLLGKGQGNGRTGLELMTCQASWSKWEEIWWWWWNWCSTSSKNWSLHNPKQRLRLNQEHWFLSCSSSYSPSFLLGIWKSTGQRNRFRITL